MTTTTTVPMFFRIPIPKINDIVELDLGKCPASSQYYNHWNGLKQRYNDAHSSITVKTHPDPVKREAAVRAVLETITKQYTTGTCPPVDVIDDSVIAAVQMMSAVIALPEPTRETVIATLPVDVQTKIRARMAAAVPTPADSATVTGTPPSAPAAPTAPESAPESAPPAPTDVAPIVPREDVERRRARGR